MDIRTLAVATHSRVHRTIFISLTLPPKHSTNFVLCRTPVNNLEHPCHNAGSQTALHPTVSLTHLLFYSVNVPPYATNLLTLKYKVIPNFNVLRPLMKLWIFCKFHCPSIVNI